MNSGKFTFGAALAAATAMTLSGPAMAAWEPSKPVEFVVPAGTGGGADQMARLIQGIIVKHKLMKESMIVVNKSGGAGAEVMRRIAAPMVGGMFTAPLLSLFVIPAAYLLIRRRGLERAALPRPEDRIATETGE